MIYKSIVQSITFLKIIAVNISITTDFNYVVVILVIENT